MRQIKKADGSYAIVMNDEPKAGRAKGPIITTHDVNPVTWEKRRRAAAEAVRAEAAAAKIEAEKKGAQNAKA
jgi:hypothetical protein